MAAILSMYQCLGKQCPCDVLNTQIYCQLRYLFNTCITFYRINHILEINIAFIFSRFDVAYFVRKMYIGQYCEREIWVNTHMGK